MKIIIKNNDNEPIYEQIKQQIKTAILSNELYDGDILPSLRKLSRELRISVLTTTRAYTELEQEGYVKNIQGKGCYVTNRSSEILKENMFTEIENHLDSAIHIAKISNVNIITLHNLLDTLWGMSEE